MKIFSLLTVVSSLTLALVSCNGVLDDIYDTPAEYTPVKGQIVVDASSWTDWYYVDLKALRSLAESGDDEAFVKASTEFEPYPIPTTLTGVHDGCSGQYLYWFDVWGEGVGKNEFRSFTPCDRQPEPPSWTFAVHRNNVRTNGGAALETSFTSMDELPETSSVFADMAFTEDEWSENDVWDSQEQMLLCLIPSQGIKTNRVLSSWLSLKIPPMPPVFVHNSHVFILRLNDGTYAALQLQNYISQQGEKCYLTINYKYPY